MRTIEARAIISAKDATGMVFSAIGRKIAGLTATARNANLAAAGAAKRAGAAEAAAAGSGRASAAAAAAAGRFVAAPALRFLAPAAAAYGGVQSVRRYAETDMALTRIGITADATDAEIGKLSTSLRDLAFETGKSFDDVTSGLESMVAGGFDLPQALPALPAIAKTAQAAGAEVKDMATTTLALNQALGIATDKMQSAFDVLVAGGKAGKFELKDMARYMPSILPAATALGLKGEEGLKKIVAMMQAVRAGTGTTEEAASSLQNIFAKMESEATSGKFEKFGIDLGKEMKKARKEGRDLLTVFMELTEKAIKGDMSKIPQLFTDMEFARGMRALLTYKNVLDDVTTRLNSAGGSAAADFERVLNRPKVAIDRLSESWDRLKESLGRGLDAIGVSTGMDKTARFIENAVEHWQNPTAEKARAEIEARRRAPLEREMREVERRIEQIEKTDPTKSPTLFQRLMGHPGANRDKILADLRQRVVDLEGQLAAKTPEEMPPLFSDKERELLEERDREHRRAQALTDMGKNRTGKRVSRTGKMGWNTPAPNDGSAGENNILDLPPVKAELTGSAEVSGETTVKVEVEVKPSGELLNAIATAKNTTAQMRGQLNSNGPGSTGRSSPDAAAPAPPISY